MLYDKINTDNFLKMAKTTKSVKIVKNKEVGKMETISFIVNFCAIFTLIFTFGLLILRDAIGSDMAQATVSEALCDSSCDCAAESKDQPAVLFPVTAGQPNEGSIKITMDDGGYLQDRFVLSPEGTKMLEITNKGVNAHSFVIDELAIDSGVIEPGQTRTIALDSLPDEPLDYIFYSNLSDDDKENFSGVFAVE